MFARLVLIFFLLVGVVYGQNKPYVDPELRQPVNEWLKDCDKYKPMGWEVYNMFDSILVDDMMEYNMLGICIPSRNVILINREVLSNGFLLKLVVYHELGHCILHKSHICDRISIMNPNMEQYDIEEYEILWNGLLVEYFGGVGIRCPKLHFFPVY